MRAITSLLKLIIDRPRIAVMDGRDDALGPRSIFVPSAFVCAAEIGVQIGLFFGILYCGLIRWGNKVELNDDNLALSERSAI